MNFSFLLSYYKYIMSIDDVGLSKILVIDSSKRISGQSSSNFSVLLGNSHEAHKVLKVSLVSFKGTNSVYNITPSNNKLSITTNLEGPLIITINPAFYDVAELNAEIDAQVNAVITNVLTSTLDAKTLKITTVIDVGTFVFNDTPDSIYNTIGITTLPTPSGASYLAPNVPHLSGLVRIFLRSSALASNNSAESDGSSGNIMAVIPSEAKLADPITYLSPTEESDTILYNGVTDLTTIDVRLTDKDDNLIDFNGSECSFVLKIYYKR